MSEESKIREIPVMLQKKYRQCDCPLCNETRDVGTYEKEYKGNSPCRKESFNDLENVVNDLEDIMDDDRFYRFTYFILYSITLVAVMLMVPMLFLI